MVTLHTGNPNPYHDDKLKARQTALALLPEFWKDNWLTRLKLVVAGNIIDYSSERVVKKLNANPDYFSESLRAAVDTDFSIDCYSVFCEKVIDGPIPPELPRLTRLVYLGLSWNQLTGPIPPELGQLTGLRALNLFDNQLSGPIPPELGQLTNLELLHLDDNQLTGPIPPELGQLTALSTMLGLSQNQLSGPIPPELGRLTNLERLQLSFNQLSGPIPPELGQLTNLVFLTLSTNQLSGPIPPELGQLTRLTSLLLHGNQLSGPIPVEFGTLTELTLLRIDSDTGLCLPPEIQDTVFGQLALDENVPLCAAVTALPLAALWVLALALAVLGLRRNGMQRQPAV